MLKIKYSVLFFFSLLLHRQTACAMSVEIGDSTLVKIIALHIDSMACQNKNFFTDSLHQKKDTAKEIRKKKIVSAIFAFPFPFGFMGAHRIMLGTSPWVPVVYVATFGGCFGLLPLIDFFVITFSKDIEQYENNPHVFMWVK
jgi:TM2 domain-containing membrane protein YozV